MGCRVDDRPADLSGKWMMAVRSDPLARQAGLQSVAPRELRATTGSAEQTRQLAAAVAALVTPGDVVVLAGEMGVGKTTFAKGFGRALGVVAEITSPTFVLRRSYSCVASGLLGPDGRAATLVHADAYRLGSLGEAFDLDLASSLDEGAIVLVEWGDAIVPLLGRDHLGVSVKYGPSETMRLLELTTSGEAWQDRRLMLEVKLSRWRWAGAPPTPSLFSERGDERAGGDRSPHRGDGGGQS